ncbi:MAG: sulfurtransferase [Pseudomonadota bacterium]|nr:sulfurtransferase [Pseudomonadota bacterium]
MAGWTTLVQAETLAMALNRNDVAIVDCRFTLLDPNAGEQAYQRSHLPGAVYAHLERDLSDMTPSGDGRHPWPSVGQFAARLSRWHIGPTSQVIAYDHGDGSIAARLWFLLRMLGHEKVAVVDGGWARWTALGLPVSSWPSTSTGQFRAQYDAAQLSFDSVRLFDADAVEAHLFTGGMLVDARAAPRFRGDEEPLDRIAGHVPGAINRPYTENLVDGRFKSPMQLAEEFRGLLGDNSATDVVAMCGSGVTACHHLLAMERAGFKSAGLYTGSWSGWISDHSRPIATGP